MPKWDRENHTICWDCRKACGDCSWSDHWKHEPVPGWTAIQVPIKMNGEYSTTFVVKACPEFDPDPPRKPFPDKLKN